MKKYIIGMVAMIMVVVASAFAVGEKTTPLKTDAVTYWFAMDASGTNVTTTQLSDPLSVCPNPGSDCAREYNESQTVIVDGIRQVKSGQENLQIDSRGKQ